MDGTAIGTIVVVVGLFQALISAIVVPVALYHLDKRYTTKEATNRIGAKVNKQGEEQAATASRVVNMENRQNIQDAEMVRLRDHIERSLIGPIREQAAEIRQIREHLAAKDERDKNVERMVEEVRGWVLSDMKEER